MSPIIKRLSLALRVVLPIATIVSTARVGLAQGPAIANPPSEGVLLLRNGSLLRGEITESGDGFDVVVDSGRIHVKPEDVEFHCRNLEEGYRQKRASIRPGDFRAYLDLAQWCQRHGLLERAAEELARARALEPSHPLIPLIERRIEVSLVRPEPIDAQAGRPGDHPAERGTARVDPSPSSEELDRSVRELPPGAVEEFTQTIQPILVNRCSAAGCHGPGSDQAFRLLRIPSSRPASRRLTQRNLHGTLAWVDRDKPRESKLLTVPVQPHGSAEAMFTDHQRDQYQRIVDWVHQVAGQGGSVAGVAAKPPEERPPHVRLPWQATAAAHTEPVAPSGDQPSNVVPAVPTAGVRASQATGVIGFRPGGIPRTTDPMVQRGASLPDAAPVDPFDAEVFNRRFFPQKRASSPIGPDVRDQPLGSREQAVSADRAAGEAPAAEGVSDKACSDRIHAVSERASAGDFDRETR